MDKPVLYFDGYCGLCSASVDFVIANDRKKIFFFSPLQSDYALKNLPEAYTKSLSSLVLQEGTSIYTQSDAVIRIAENLGGIWKAAILLKLAPVGLRNWVYDMIARNRYRWFGKKETCRLPTLEERQRFLL